MSLPAIGLKLSEWIQMQKAFRTVTGRFAPLRSADDQEGQFGLMSRRGGHVGIAGFVSGRQNRLSDRRFTSLTIIE